MANEFSTRKTKSSSEKFNLIRIEPARYVSSDLALSSGTTYTLTFAFKNIARIKVDGTTYTKTTGAPSSSEYTFDESTKLLTINLGAALTTQSVIAFYYIFYTTNEAKVTYEDPVDSSTTSRIWEPRVKATPSFQFNLKDILNGRLSFGVSTLVIENQDMDFNKYLTDNDSFANKRIWVWLCLDRVEHVSIVFRGYINKLSVSENVTFTLFDEFSALDKTYFSNSTYLKSTYNSTKFANIHPKKENKPIHRLFAETSYYEVIDNGVASGLYKLSGSRLLEAHCTNYTPVVSTSNNRVWGACLSEGDGGVQTDSVQATDHTDSNFSLLDYTNGKNYKIGDTLEIGATPHRVRVLSVDTDNDQIKTTKNASIATSDTITRPGISIVITQSDTFYYPLYGRDFTLDYSGNTNSIIEITFTSNFEATLGMNALDPDNDFVGFRAWADTGSSFNHGTVVQTMLQDAGLNVNAASIATANGTSINTNFYIPYVDEQQFKSYSSYIEKLLQSTFGYLSLNNSLEIEYHLFAAPSASDTITSREILKESFLTEIDYNDVRSSIVPENPHDIFELDYANAGLEENKALYLHEIETSKAFDHVLKGTARMQKILDVVSERRAIYYLKSKVNPDVIVGDEFSVSRDDNLVGVVSEKDLKVISIDKTDKDVRIGLTDLLGL